MKPLWTQIWIFLFCWLTIRNPPYSNKHRMRATCQYHSSRWHENSGQLNLSVHERSCSCLIYKVKWSRSVVSNSLRPHGLVAHQAPQSMGFSRQEYWRGLPFPSPLRLVALIPKYLCSVSWEKKNLLISGWRNMPQGEIEINTLMNNIEVGDLEFCSG